MSDRYTEVTRTSFGQNLMNSVAGVLVGVVLFILSFPVLWWNQGRVNLGKVAESSVAVTAVEPANDGKLVAASGNLTVEGQIADDPYLKPGDYVVIDRNAEMYAWVEHSESTSKDKVGGGTETTTTYEYKKEWTSSPASSSSFKHPEGHSNPEMTVEATRRYAPAAKVGPFGFTPEDCGVSANESLSLSPEIVNLPGTTTPPTTGVTHVPSTAPAGGAAMDDEAGFVGEQPAQPAQPLQPLTPVGSRARLEGNSIYIGTGSEANPVVGDIKITYQVRRPGSSVTVFGQQQGDQLTAYLHKGKTRLFRLFDSDRDTAIQTMKVEHKVIGWVIGIAGFLMMWIGMSSVFGPLIAVAKVIPFIGQIGEKAVGCATFPIAVVMSLVVVFISKIVHSPIVMLILGVAVAAGLFVLVKKKAAGAAAEV